MRGKERMGQIQPLDVGVVAQSETVFCLGPRQRLARIGAAIVAGWNSLIQSATKRGRKNPKEND
jgi:hypothetical protein